MEPHSAAVLTVRAFGSHRVGLPPLAPLGRSAGSKGLGFLAAGFSTMQPRSLHWPKGGGAPVPLKMYLCVQHGTSWPELPSHSGLPMPQPLLNQKQAWPREPVRLRGSLPAASADGWAHQFGLSAPAPTRLADELSEQKGQGQQKGGAHSRCTSQGGQNSRTIACAVYTMARRREGQG